ncbi:hypothetical protein ABZX85_21730 [Streptomyces sp. NPDC004539]|uniref:hypothetical protein n=1 Tax=Streptomyces sp. NPDC004539 TaxID=3154280 RepID=UPI0033A25E96
MHTVNSAVDTADSFVRWPLAALTLFWLARHDQRLYARGAVALLLTGAGGVAVLVARQGLPGHETSLVQDYLALPGVSAGWYVLMALALTNGTPAGHRARALVVLPVGLVALVVSAGAVLTADQRALGALLAVGVPLAAWWIAGQVPGAREVRGGRAERSVGTELAVEAVADVVPLRASAEGAPLRRAG